MRIARISLQFARLGHAFPVMINEHLLCFTDVTLFCIIKNSFDINGHADRFLNMWIVCENVYLLQLQYLKMLFHVMNITRCILWKSEENCVICLRGRTP